MRKAFLLGGVALLIAAVSLAGQRTRGGSGPSLRGDDGKRPAAFREVGEGVVEFTTPSGFTATLHADGKVLYDETIAQFGSTERQATEIGLMHVENTVAPDGARISANGTVAYFADLVGSRGPEIWTVESHKQVAAWAEVGSGPTARTLFADGVVTQATAPEQPWRLDQERNGGLSAQNGSDKIRADGAVYK